MSLPTAPPLPDAAWITTPHIPVDYRGPVNIDYTKLIDPARADPIITLLHAAVMRQPNALIIEDASAKVTYRAFFRAVLRLAHLLTGEHYPPGPAALLLPPSAAYAVAVFACIAAGRLFVLLDESYPGRTNADIAAATGVKLVLTLSEQSPASGWPGVTVFNVAAALDDTAASPQFPRHLMGLDEPACVMCTSGSSGAPKAIVHSQRTLLHWARSTQDALHVRAQDRALSLSSLSTLGGFTALLTYPLAGATIQLIDIKAAGLAGLLAILATGRVTIIRAAPSMLRALAALPDSAAALAAVRLVQAYGEPFMKADLCALQAILPAGCKVRTTYASTESSGLSWFAGAPDAYDPGRVAAGCLMPDTAAAIVDEDGNSCRPGEPGELVIRSRYNALGEWSRGQMVPGRLEPHPSGDGTRVYHTGDIARYHPDGVFVVLGRKDRMVKLNGQRLEPAEIETVLRAIPSVAQAEVIVRQNSGTPQLVAFVVPHGKAPVGLVATLRSALRAQLPAYMVPARILLVADIPILASGKIDGLALQAMAEIR